MEKETELPGVSGSGVTSCLDEGEQQGNISLFLSAAEPHRSQSAHEPRDQSTGPTSGQRTGGGGQSVGLK